jgi:hypothetical protein
MTQTLLPTTVVGSYPQPDWLIDPDKLTTLPPVRVPASELWRVPERWLEQAQDVPPNGVSAREPINVFGYASRAWHPSIRHPQQARREGQPRSREPARPDARTRPPPYKGVES